MSWTIDLFTTRTQSNPMYWGDLTRGPLDTQAVRTKRVLEVQCFRNMQVYGKVPVEQARQGGYYIL